MYKNYKMTDPNANNYYTLKTNLKTYNTILKKSIRISQIKYYEAIFCKFKGDIRGTWKTINDILNRTKRKKTFPSSFKDGENIMNDKITIANKKTKYMIFHTAQRKVNTLHLTTNNTIIERVTQFDFLGLTLNENLT